MNREYEEAFTEIDEIFKIMPIDLLSKIPAQYRQIISENKARDYDVKIQEPLDEKNLKKETVVILGLIYRDFLASPEERDELQKKDAEELQRLEQEMQQQYNMENVFQNRKNKYQEAFQEQTDLVVYKEEGFLRKFFNMIKSLFKKK